MNDETKRNEIRSRSALIVSSRGGDIEYRADTVEARTQVFICYRQVDGTAAARWLYERLHGRTHAAQGHGGADLSSLDLYFDQAAPALGDWQTLHRPSLESAHAMLVVCTPGLLSRLGPDDWVHTEIDWWLQHRKTAPILVDTTGEGARWIPASILSRWPNAQRLPLNIKEFEAMPEPERSRQIELLLQRITGGITVSDGSVRFEELEQQKILLAKQRRFLGYALVGLAAAAAASGVAAWFAHRVQIEAERHLAGTLMEQAIYAWELDNGDFAKILSVEALAHDDSRRTRNAAAAIHDWYASNRAKALKRFESLLSDDYENLVNESAPLNRAQRYARGLSVVSALNTYLTLTGAAHQTGYDWVYRLGGFEARVECSFRGQMRAARGAANLATELTYASSEVARLSYHRPDSREQAHACDELRASVARETTSLERTLAGQVADRALRPFEAKHRSVELQQRLKHGQALIHFWRYRDRYVAWVVTRDNSPTRVELGSSFDVERAVKEFNGDFLRGLAQRPGKDSSSGASAPGMLSRGLVFSTDGGEPDSALPGAGVRLRRLLWDPLQVALSGQTVVYIVPDGAIASIPFAALPDGDGARQLLDRVHFAYLTSAHDLLDDVPRISGGDVLLVAGDIGGVGGKSRGSSKCASEIFDRAMFPPLPSTRHEVQEISRLLHTAGQKWSPRVLLGEEADEESVRQQMPGSRILHFATHGWLDVNLLSPERELAIPDTTAAIDPYLVNADPMLGTGLLLGRKDPASGARDGVLTGYEIATMNLQGVDLAVLSGCDTAGSSRGGNGLVGLVAAFREAGVRTVVASLYPVADETTALLMVDFYRSLLDGFSPTAALTTAMLRLRDAGYSAYYWAPFVAYSTGPSG